MNRKNFPRHFKERGDDTDLDCTLRLSPSGIFEIQGQVAPFHAANAQIVTTKSL
jgi:hypothetical protein